MLHPANHKAHSVTLRPVTNHFQRIRSTAQKVATHATFRQSHHLIYCCYYAIAVASERGVMLLLSSGLLIAAIVVAVANAKE